jgi:hypothetical protein
LVVSVGKVSNQEDFNRAIEPYLNAPTPEIVDEAFREAEL